MSSLSAHQTTRRDFLESSSKVAAGSLVISCASGRPVSAEVGNSTAGESQLKIGLVGCGGRGAGATNQALTADDGTTLHAMCDVNREVMNKAEAILSKGKPDRVDVPEERRYSDFEGYKRVIAECDVVILATSPGFRPLHFEEAVAQGKHVFMEKPVASDVAGIKRVLAAGQAAKAKNLKVAVGLQRRHQPGYQEWIKRIQDGGIGDVLVMRALWNGSSRPGKPRIEGESELEYQIRNWYYFTWLSGDHNVEQHVHNLDVANWIKGEQHPVIARGMGGREVRNAPENGQIYDHHFIEYEYADGTILYSQARQIPNCARDISESAIGTLGRANLMQREFTITGPNAKVKRFRKNEDGHQLEHYPFFKAIREDLEHNEAERGANATMTAILGRMSNYSGQPVTWEDAMASNQQLVPDGLIDFSSEAPVHPDKDGRYPVAVPGVSDPFKVWY
ncbi:Gfo/Idh/MocA family oxidoreductase [Verrucomicrobiales bacterium BCK34]|nr:Gfo/Idh/MocA family oxidoreductase [Verrucomicrobiales bacterium BCK34]